MNRKSTVINYRVPKAPKGSYAKTFRISLPEFESGIKGIIKTNEDIGQIAKEIASDEMRRLFQYIIIPTLKDYSPYKELGSHSNKPKLRDTIRSIATSDGLGREIVMGWWGGITINGRSALPDRPGNHPYPIVLDDGEVIFRSSGGLSKIGRATTRSHKFFVKEFGREVPRLDPTDAYYRMNWANRAYYYIRNKGWLEQTTKNITTRILAATILDNYEHEAEFSDSSYARINPQSVGRPTNRIGDLQRKIAKIRNAREKNKNNPASVRHKSEHGVGLSLKKEIARRDYEENRQNVVKSTARINILRRRITRLTNQLRYEKDVVRKRHIRGRIEEVYKELNRYD